VAVCSRVRGWFVLHGVDESVGEAVISARERARRKVYAEQDARTVGSGVEEAK